jgi:hypothetical protein
LQRWRRAFSQGLDAGVKTLYSAPPSCPRAHSTAKSSS